jgi:Icc-related predicted phosphoesterase
MSKKTKIMAIGDIHGDKGLIKKLAEKAIKEKVDLIIIAGDLTFFEISFKDLIGPLVKTNKEVLIIPGNHESNELINYLSEIYQIKNIHGNSFKKGDLGIFGAGLADVGPYFTHENEIFSLLKKGYSQIKESTKKIMVTHMHHKGGKSEKITGIEGSEDVYKALKEFKPDFLISAHLHEVGGLEEQFNKTKIINVSKKEKIFEI